MAGGKHWNETNLPNPETVAGAQAKADKARTDAISAAATDATSKANTAEVNAKASVTAHGDLKTAHGATSLSTASTMVVRDSSGRTRFKAPNHEEDAANMKYVDDAKAAAISAAATDANTKANNAQTAAISAAAVDATTKANNAQAAAISAAAIDATDKAETARASAYGQASDDLINHANDTTSAHGAVSASTANRIVVRDSAGRARFKAPNHDEDAANRKFVNDAKTEAMSFAANEVSDLSDHIYDNFMRKTGLVFDEKILIKIGSDTWELTLDPVDGAVKSKKL